MNNAKILSKLLYTLLGTLALFLGLIITGIFFIRTSTGITWIKNTVSSLLQQQGIILQLSSIIGPFPEQITINELSLSDVNGTYLTISNLEIQSNLWALFKGQLEILSFELNDLILHRLPSNNNLKKSSTSFVLPHISFDLTPWWTEHIRIQNIHINNAQLSPDIIGIPLVLSLEGDGTLTNWDGTFQLSSPNKTKIIGMLHYQRNKTQFFEYVHPTRILTLEIDSVADKKSYNNSILEQPLHLHLSIYPEHNRIILHSLLAEYGSWLLTSESIEVSNEKLKGNILLKYSGEATHQLPIRKLNSSITLSGSLNKPNFNIQVTLPKLNIAKNIIDLQTELVINLGLFSTHSDILTSGTITVHGNTIPNNILSSAVDIVVSTTTDTITLEHATLTAPEMHFSLSGEFNNLLGNIDANLKGNTPTLNIFSSLLGLPDLTGQSNITIELHRQESSSPIEGTATVSFNNMNWGIQALQGALGDNATLSGIYNFTPTDWSISLNKLKLTAKNVYAEGLINFQKKYIDSSINLIIPNLQLIAPPISGELQSLITVSGELDAPSIESKIFSPQLTWNALQLNNPQLIITTTQSSSSAINGNITLSAEPASSEALTFSSNWGILPTEILVEKITGNILGVNLDGNIKITKKDYLINGDIIAEVQSWKDIATILQIPIRGSTSIKIQFDPKNQQSISTQWQLKNFILGNNFNVTTIKGIANITQLHENPTIALSSKIGAGTYEDFQWTQGTLDIKGTLKDLNSKINIAGQTTVKANFQTNLFEKNINITTLNLKNIQKNIGIKLLQPTKIIVSPQQFVLNNCSLAILPSGTITTDIYITPQRLNANATIKEVSLLSFQPFSMLLPQGNINGNITLTGIPTKPKGTLSFDILNIHYPRPNPSIANLHVKGEIISSPNNICKLNATLTEKKEPIPISIQATLPFEFTENNIPILSKIRPFSAHIKWTGILDTLWKLIPLTDYIMAGNGSLDASLSGTLDNPTYAIITTLSNANFQDLSLGLYLENINAKLQIFSNRISHIQATASDGKQGSIQVVGNIDSSKEHFPLSINGSFTNLAPLQRKDLSLTLSGAVTLAGTLKQSEIKGDIVINQGEFQLTEGLTSNIPTLNVVDSTQKQNTKTQKITYQQPTLSIALSIPNRFFVRSSMFESEWGGNLTINRIITSPVITGELTSIRGNFNLLGKQFSLAKSTISFSGAVPPNPLLNISLTYTSPSITAIGIIEGTTSNPNITFSSTPPLPQDEIVSQVLFGKGSQSLSRIQAIQLAQELANLTGFNTGSMNLLTNIRQTLGLDILSLGTTSNRRTNTSNSNDQIEDIPVIELGKYITDTVYVGVEQSYLDSNDTGARISVELAPSFNLEGRTGTQSSEIGINWKKDY